MALPLGAAPEELELTLVRGSAFDQPIEAVDRETRSLPFPWPTGAVVRLDVHDATDAVVASWTATIGTGLNTHIATVSATATAVTAAITAGAHHARLWQVTAGKPLLWARGPVDVRD